MDTIKQKLVELVAVQGPRPEIGWIGFAEEKKHKQGKLLAAMGNLTTKNMKLDGRQDQGVRAVGPRATITSRVNRVFLEKLSKVRLFEFC